MRRSWPQRLVLVLGVVLAGGCFVAAAAIGEVDERRRSIPHAQFDVGVEHGLEPVADPGQPINILLIGVDEAVGIEDGNPILIGREGSQNTDAIIVVRLDPRTRRAYMLSIPRDLYVDYATSSSGRINAAYAIGGPQELQQTITSALGIRIHRVITVNLAGFAAVVDEIGGIEVYFENETRSIATHFRVDAGCHKLDGFEALAYVRVRSDYQEVIDGQFRTTGRSDFDRMARQQQFLTLALRQVFDRVGRDSRDLFNLIDVIVDSDALTLDNTTSPQDLRNMAGPFSDFSPESLQHFTLAPPLVRSANIPGLSALEIDEDQAAPILRIFQGYDEGSIIPLVVSSDTPELIEQISLKETFDVTEVPPTGSRPTTIRASLDQLDQAMQVASWLADLPALEIVGGQGVLELHFGNDDPKVRLFDANGGDDWEGSFNNLVQNASEAAGDVDEALPTTSSPDGVTTTTTTTTASTTTPVAGGDAVPTTVALLPGECPPS